jgi:dephospho-CoA kinase
MIIGITGSIGSGKTTVAKIFSRHKFTRIDADKISHELIEKGHIKNRLIMAFGKGILDKNDNVNRKKLGKIAFSDNKKLKILNAIMHPEIISEIKKQINAALNKLDTKPKIVLDSPLLLETKAKKLVDKVVVVKAELDKVKSMNKKFTKLEIERILKRQMILKEKLKYADYVISNSKDKAYLKKQVKSIIKKVA